MSFNSAFTSRQNKTVRVLAPLLAMALSAAAWVMVTNWLPEDRAFFRGIAASTFAMGLSSLLSLALRDFAERKHWKLGWALTFDLVVVFIAIALVAGAAGNWSLASLAICTGFVTVMDFTQARLSSDIANPND